MMMMMNLCFICCRCEVEHSAHQRESDTAVVRIVRDGNTGPDASGPAGRHRHMRSSHTHQSAGTQFLHFQFCGEANFACDLSQSVWVEVCDPVCVSGGSSVTDESVVKLIDSSVAYRAFIYTSQHFP